MALVKGRRLHLSLGGMWAHELKLARARQHLKELQAKVWKWEGGDGYALYISEDARPPSYIARAEILKPVEEDPYSLLVGDFLQNARSALDYIASALGDVGAGGVMSESDAARTMFPIVGDIDPWRVSGDSPSVFAERAKARLPTVPAPARAVIEDLQPYKKGGDLWAYEPLWILNELARFDRHRFLQLGVVRAGGLTSTLTLAGTSRSPTCARRRDRFLSWRELRRRKRQRLGPWAKSRMRTP